MARRSEAAAAFLRREWLWEITLIVFAATTGGAIILLFLINLGVMQIKLTPERELIAMALIALNGGLFFPCRDRLFRLLGASSANLTSLSEAETLEKIVDLEVRERVWRYCR